MGRLIGITGGIGSGKSVVSHICTSLGYKVYDCDVNAKLLMDNDAQLKEKLCACIGNHIIDDEGNINRPVLAECIFSDSRKRQLVNTLVHSKIRSDIESFALKEIRLNLLFVESAIMKSSGLDRMMDEIWIVSAQEKLRIDRVMKRNGLERKNVISRIESQRDEYQSFACDNVKQIFNNESDSLLLQVVSLLKEYQ